jgi:ATP-dependent Clp protease adapter protein ClpS
MAEKRKPGRRQGSRGKRGTARGSGTQAPSKPQPKKIPPKPLPPWKVILHNDEVNAMPEVVETIAMLTPLGLHEAVVRMLEAHYHGRSLLLSTHRERAELYVQQFASRRLTVTIEPG